MIKMNKKSFIAVLLIILTLSLIACDKTPPEKNEEFLIILSGDIESYYREIDLLKLQKRAFTYTDKEGTEVNTEGYRLDEVIDPAILLSDENYLMITASDGVSARINFTDASLCYIIINDGKADLKAPSHPPAAGIKDILDISVISESEINQGLKIVKEDGHSVMSYGNVKSVLFEEVAQSTLKGVPVYKHMPKAVSVKEFTGEDENILYFHNYDIIVEGGGNLIWSGGRLAYKEDGKIYESLTGIVTGTDTLILDAYYDIKQAVDSGERVMVILPDGFSYGQAEHFNDQLTLFKSGYIKAASVNPAISNVALAAIVTGKSPRYTEITKRGVNRPASQDIFDYAVEKGKSVSYIDGNSNLILTNIIPEYNAPDSDGYTDGNVFQSAMDELNNNPDFIFVHFHGIDDANHDYSPLSDQALDKILEIEQYTKTLMENFDGKIIIVPDHGSVTVQGDTLTGRHGVFETGDMYVPYYVIAK
jgi:hypothetical protein